MGKRYTQEEIDQIQALTSEGHTDHEIAERLGRTENAIRNIRHRTHLQSETKQSLQSLQRERATLNDKVAQLRRETRTLQSRREEVSKALQIEEEALYGKLHAALRRMKDHKPELFYTTTEEQVGKIAGLLTKIFIKWLFEGA